MDLCYDDGIYFYYKGVFNMHINDYLFTYAACNMSLICYRTFFIFYYA